jgi:hypothetical protein
MRQRSAVTEFRGGFIAEISFIAHSSKGFGAPAEEAS